MGLTTIKLARKKFPRQDAAHSERLLSILKKGTRYWNQWRTENPFEFIDLRGINLSGSEVDLSGVDLQDANIEDAGFSRVNLQGANLSASYAHKARFQGTELCGVKFRGSYLSSADFYNAELEKADLRLAAFDFSILSGSVLDYSNCRRATFRCTQFDNASITHAMLAEADFQEANLRATDFSGSDLSEAILTGANLVEANLEKAKLNGCNIYGVSVWKAKLSESQQQNLIITPDGEPTITIDNLKIAQFVYLILNNSEIREVIDTLTSKTVLILGRFSAERKVVLDKIRDTLRQLDYVPIMFDFSRPSGKTFLETVRALAAMARFVIADITDAKVIFQELQGIVGELPSVPVQPIVLKGTEVSDVFLDFMMYDWFLPIYQYDGEQQLLNSIKEKIISPSEKKILQRQIHRDAAAKLLKDMNK